MSAQLCTSDGEPIQSIIDAMTDFDLDTRYQSPRLTDEEVASRPLHDPVRIVHNEPKISFGSDRLLVLDPFYSPSKPPESESGQSPSEEKDVHKEELLPATFAEKEMAQTEDLDKAMDIALKGGLSALESSDSSSCEPEGLELIPDQQQAYGLGGESDSDSDKPIEIKMSAFDALKATVESSSDEEEKTQLPEEEEDSFEERFDDLPTIFKPPLKESEASLKDDVDIYKRVESALGTAEHNIAYQLMEHLGLTNEPKEILEQYVGTDVEADTPLYTNAKFFQLFVTSVMMYGCRLALQEISQKSDNQKISKSPHPFLRGTQRTDLWKQFWGTQMPERGQALEDLQASYQAELPILRIWSFFRRKTSAVDFVCGRKMASQWNYPLISALMFSSRFRFTLGRIPEGSSYTDGTMTSKQTCYCALTGVPIRGGKKAYLCSFLCEVTSIDTSEARTDPPLQVGGGGKRGRKRGKKTESVQKMVRSVQEISCVVCPTLPSQSGKERVDSAPLLKALRTISEFDKVIAAWVSSWVKKHGSKLPSKRRDSVAYGMTSTDGLREIGKWYTTFHVLVALTHQAM